MVVMLVGREGTEEALAIAATVLVVLADLAVLLHVEAVEVEVEEHRVEAVVEVGAREVEPVVVAVVDVDGRSEREPDGNQMRARVGLY